MKFVLASAVALVAVTSLADAQTTTPTIPKCGTAVAKAWLTSDDAKKCHAPIGYPAATYAPPNATTFEAFCPNEFCMKTLSAVLALKPTPDYDCYTVFKGNWNFYSTVVDVFANACKSTTPAPTTSSPAPTTTAPAPTTSAPAPTPTPTTTAPPTLPRCDTAVAKAWLTSDDAKKCHAPIGYPAATYAPPNATTFEAFCPNEFCMKTLSAVLALKPTPDYDCYTVFKGNWNFYSTVVDVFANACKSVPTPSPSSSPPAPTSSPPTPTSSPPTPTSSPPTPTSSGPSPTPTSSSSTPTSVTPSPKPRPSC